MNKIKAEEINQNIVHSIDKGETIKQQDWVVGEGGVGGRGYRRKMIIVKEISNDLIYFRGRLTLTFIIPSLTLFYIYTSLLNRIFTLLYKSLNLTSIHIIIQHKNDRNRAVIKG